MPNSIKHTRSREAASWLRKEIIEQKARFRKIEREMNVTIAAQRDKWIDAFLERLQTRGHSIEGMRRGRDLVHAVHVAAGRQIPLRERVCGAGQPPRWRREARR